MTVRWGMLSAAAIGRVVAAAIRDVPDAEFAAVAGRDPARAAGHAAELGILRSLDSYDALLADDGIDEAARTGARVTPARYRLDK
jgi:xylose dehydrogenase (NAD/NADP)